jgi:hypothetical protein
MKSVLAIAFFFSMAIGASEVQQWNQTLCGKSAGIQSWTYDYTGNVTDGVKDQQGLVKVTYMPIKLADGKISQSMISYKVKGLKWDKSFKHLVYTDGAAPVVCGKLRRFSTKKYEKNCVLESLSRNVVNTSSTECLEVDSTDFVLSFKVL